MKVTPRPPTVAGSPSEGPNALGRALLVLGDHRNLDIIRAAFQGARRFGDWQQLTTISDPVLSGRLRALVEDGIFTTSPYSTTPLRNDYLLTERGLDLWKVLVTLWMWEARWAPDHPWGRSVLVHRECGHGCSPLLGCHECGALRVTPRETSARVLDGSFERSNPSRRYRRAPRVTHAEVTDSALTATDLLGDRWGLSLIAASFLGTRRFGDFQRQLATIQPQTLTDRLSLFVDQQLMRRVSVAEGGRRMQYRLTPKGLDFFPAMTAIVSWTNRWVTPGREPTIIIDHEICGRVLSPELRCNACRRPLERTDARLVDDELFTK